MALPAEMQKIRPGSPRPLGATVTPEGTNFAVYSSAATSIQICLFEDGSDEPAQVYTLPDNTQRVWHGFIPEVEPGTLYGIRAHGPWEPENGFRFNPNKLLLDPYARAVVGEPVWDETIHWATISKWTTSRTMPTCRRVW